MMYSCLASSDDLPFSLSQALLQCACVSSSRSVHGFSDTQPSRKGGHTAHCLCLLLQSIWAIQPRRAMQRRDRPFERQEGTWPQRLLRRSPLCPALQAYSKRLSTG